MPSPLADYATRLPEHSITLRTYLRRLSTNGQDFLSLREWRELLAAAELERDQVEPRYLAFYEELLRRAHVHCQNLEAP